MGNSNSIPAQRGHFQTPAEQLGPPGQHAQAPQSARPSGQTRLTTSLAAPRPPGQPPARQAAAQTANPELAQLLPETLVGQIASYLPLPQFRQVGELGPRAQGARRELKSLEAPCLALLTRIEGVVDLGGFESALGNVGARDARHPNSISHLRRDLRNAPLLALTNRIAALPEADRPAARLALLGAIHSVDPEYQSPALKGIERIAQQGNVSLSIQAGENLRQIVAFHGLQDQNQITVLRTRLLIDHARPAVYGAENIRNVAERYGLEEEQDLAFLEACSASRSGPAGREVAAGANFLAVARSYGIRTARGMQTLEYGAVEAAKTAVRIGGNVQAIAERHGIERATLIVDLETLAIRSRAGRAVEFGRNVEAVARACGIASDVSIKVLESYAVDRHAIPALEAGGNVREIAQRHGIRSAEWLMRMEGVALISLITTGRITQCSKNAASTATQLGIESPEMIALLTELLGRSSQAYP